MQVLSIALPLAAFASGVLAAPGWDQSGNDACLAAVTGAAALGDAGLRQYHCKSFLATTVTPAPVVETVTITADESNDKNGWKRATVAVCPNEVPNYASACDEAHYTSACSVFGFTEVKTTTVAPTTTTKTVFVKPTGGWGGSGSSCAAASTVTKTVSGSSWGAKETVTKTVTVSGGSGGSGSTITKTVSGTCSASTTKATTTSSSVPSKCVVTDAKATELAENFAILLEYTNFVPNANQSFIPPGRGYKQDVSDATLNKDFVDISDSINFMAGIPLGSVTFPSKVAFDAGQGSQPEVQVKTLNIWHDCDTITWRWVITSTQFPVVGINKMFVGDDGLLIRNYAEFDSGAWLQSFGQQCAQAPPSNSGGNAIKRSPAWGL